MNIVSKICARCKECKPDEEFSRDRGRKDGRSCYCRPCTSIRNGTKYPQVPITIKLSDTQAAYLAGLIDGEGCFSIRISKKLRTSRGFCYCPSLDIYNTHGALLAIQDEARLGYVFFRKQPVLGWKPGWAWRMTAMAIRCILPQVQPYLRIKAEQAKVMDRFLRVTRNGLRFDISEEEQRNVQDQCHLEMKLLNKRGT